MNQPTLEDLLDVAVRAARAGGEVINANSGKLNTLKVEEKSLNDFVSEVDRNSESAIKSVLHAAFPEHEIVGEEYGADGLFESDYTWYIDPLDGTTNFLRAIPHYCVSIGLVYERQIIVGVVLDPVKAELYTAARGQGAYLNGAPIEPAKKTSLHGCLLATGVPFSGTYLERLESFSNTMNELLHNNTSGIRRLGSAALDLAYVAAGRYDGYWEAGLKPWDICAGLLLVQEVGGATSDLMGAAENLKSGDVLAANKAVHAAMLTITSVHYRDSA